MHTKIKTLQEIGELLERDRKEGLTVVQCHGVFDLIHPGHIRHIQEAKRKGDKLVITLTPDRFVNKGPGRPFFNEQLRSETLAALAAVDYVVLNDTPDAVSCICKIRPSIYVKGIEYADHGADVTGKISAETEAVEQVGGVIHYTDDVVFSSSSLLNMHFDPVSPEVASFMGRIKAEYTLSDLLTMINGLSTLKVLVIGDAIIDEYQYVEPLGQSGKGLHMTARTLEREVFLGGSLIVAQHVAQFTSNVTLLTSIGKECPHSEFIKNELDPHIHTEFVYVEDQGTLTKKRYVLKDGKTISKLFETYSKNDPLLSKENSQKVIHYLNRHSSEYDLVIACDFGNGFTNPEIIEALSALPSFLAVNTQTNSGNRGFNVVTHYPRADFISLNEPELRLAAHNRHSPLQQVIDRVVNRVQCPRISVTRGVLGVFCHEEKQSPVEVPSLTTHVIDRIGAGDSYLALASLCLAKGHPMLVAGFIGSLAAAMDVQIVGNREPVHKPALCKFLTRLMK